MNVIVVERRDADRVPLPPTSKISDTISSRLSKPLYLKIASTGDSFSPRSGALADLSSFTMMKIFPRAAESRPSAR
jgi:hypothetical protein